MDPNWTTGGELLKQFLSQYFVKIRRGEQDIPPANIYKLSGGFQLALRFCNCCGAGVQSFFRHFTMRHRKCLGFFARYICRWLFPLRDFFCNLFLE